MRWFARIGVATAIALSLLAPVPAQAQQEPAAHWNLSWALKPTPVDARLRGLSAVSRKVAWASGSKGTVLRTVDGGRSWQQVGPPGTADLQFRDIEAFDAHHAVALSIGEGEASRVYSTSDGGKTWTEAFHNTEPTAFYDCMAFFGHRHGLAMSDPVNGKFRVIATEDGGRSWAVLPSDGMPPALPGEAGFAASGQCLVTAGEHDAWIGTGGIAGDGARGRVFHSSDRGRTWKVTDTPLASKATAGIFALAFSNQYLGIAIGGDFEKPDAAVDALAYTLSGGRRWHVPPQAPKGYRSGAVFLPHLPTAVIAVGPIGSDISLDLGRHWRQFDNGSFDTVDCAPDGGCWASGEKGRVAALRLAWR